MGDERMSLTYEYEVDVVPICSCSPESPKKPLLIGLKGLALSCAADLLQKQTKKGYLTSP